MVIAQFTTFQLPILALPHSFHHIHPLYHISHFPTFTLQLTSLPYSHFPTHCHFTTFTSQLHYHTTQFSIILSHHTILNNIITTTFHRFQTLTFKFNFQTPGGVADNHILCFGTKSKSFFKKMCHSKVVHMDGTFKVCPSPYSQLFTIS